MGISIPPRLEWLLLIVSGEKWPHSDETRADRMADVVNRAADRVDEAAPLLEQGVRRLGEGASGGRTEEALRTRLRRGPALLHDAAKALRNQATTIKQLAVQIQYVKMMIFGALVMLMVELLTAIAFPSVANWLRFITRAALVSRLMKLLLVRLALSLAVAVAVGTGLQVIMDLAIQLAQIHHGDRVSLDWNQIRSSAWVGALGGGLGFGLGLVAAPAFQALARRFTKNAGEEVAAGAARNLPPSTAPSPPPRGPVSSPGNGSVPPPGNGSGDFASELFVEAGAEFLTEGTASAITEGEFKANGAAVSSGAISGLAEGGGGRIGERLAGNREPTPDIPEPSTDITPAPGTPPPDTSTTPPGTTRPDTTRPDTPPPVTTTSPGPPPSNTGSQSGTAGSPPVADGTRPLVLPGERPPGSGPGSPGDPRPATERQLPTHTGRPVPAPAETGPTPVGQPGGPPLALSIPDPVLLNPTPGDTSPTSVPSTPTSSSVTSTPVSSSVSTPNTTPPLSPIDVPAATKDVADPNPTDPPGPTSPVVSTVTPGPNPAVTPTGNTVPGAPASPGSISSPTTPTPTTPQPVTPPAPTPQPVGSQLGATQPGPQTSSPQPVGPQSGVTQPGTPQSVQSGATQPGPQTSSPQPVGSQPGATQPGTPQSGATQPGPQANSPQSGATQSPGTQPSGRQVPTNVAGIPTVGTTQPGSPQSTPPGAVEQPEAQRPAATPREVPRPVRPQAATLTPEPVRPTGSIGVTPKSVVDSVANHDASPQSDRPAAEPTATSEQLTDPGAKDGDVRRQLPELLASYFGAKGPETIDTGSAVRDAELATWRVATVVASLEQAATTKADLDRRLAQVTEHIKTTERAVHEFAQVERAAGFTVPALLMNDPDFLSFAFRQEALQRSAVPAGKIAARREKLNQAYVSRLVRRRDAARELTRLKYSGHVAARDAYRRAADEAAELAPLDRATSGHWMDRAARDRFTRQWITAGDGHRRLLQRQVGGERVRETSPAAVHLEAEEADLRRTALAEQLVNDLVVARRRLGDTADPSPDHSDSSRPGSGLDTISESDETDAAPADATGPTVTGFASGGGGGSIGLPSGAGFMPSFGPTASTSAAVGRPGFASQSGGLASITSGLTSDPGGPPSEPDGTGGTGQATAKQLRPLDFGIPERLGGIRELHRALQQVLPPETGFPSLTEFEQVLRIGYPKASRDGVLLTYGSDEHAREIVVALVRSRPRLVTGHPTRGHQVVTGIHDGEWGDTSRSMQASNSMTLSAPVGTGLGTDAVLRTVTVTPSVTLGANSRSVTATSDNTAFVSQVSDNRGPSSLVTWDMEWQATVTRADETGRDVSFDLDPVTVPDGLTLWTPQYYVHNTEAEEFVHTNTRATLPPNFMAERYAGNEALFATALALIGDDNAPVGSKTRAVLRRFFDAANQSSLLASTTGARGAELVLTDADGLVIGVLRQHTELAGWRRVGAGTFQGLLEDVHVDAVKAAGSSDLGQDTATALTVQGGLFVTDEFGIGLKAGVRQGRTVKDGLSAGGVGLGVTVGRFAGQTLGYEARTTSILRYEPLVPGYRAKVSPPVPGGVQLRLREPDAVSHGLPVERTARLRTRRADRERQRLQAGQTGGPLRHPPAMVLANRGIGLSVVEDLTGAEELLAAIYPVLEQRGYLPSRRPDGRYLAPDDKEGRRRLARQFDNLAKLTNTVSKRGLTAQFEPAMQNGIPVLLEHPDGKSGPWWRNEPRSIEVTVSLQLDPANWTLADSSRHFHLVNLWISSDAPGGSRSVSNAKEVSVGAGVLPAAVTAGPIKIQLPNWTGKFKFGTSRSINSGSVVNNVELLESHDTALSYQFQYGLSAEIYERGELVAGRHARHQSVTLKLLDDVSSDVPQTLQARPFDAPRMRPQGYRSVFQRVGYVVTDTIATSQLYDAFRQVLPAALTREGKAAWSLARAFGNVENVRSHLEQISDGLYTIDHLFKEGWVRDDQGELQLKVNFGKPRYRNRTGPEFVSGRIHFGMDRAGNSASRSVGWENAWQLGGVEGVAPGAPGGVVSRSAGFQKAVAQARSTGSAVERLSLHFGRMYQFSADALFTVRGLAVQRNRFVDGSDMPRIEYVEESDGYWFWVRESDMLRLYLEDDLDVPDHVLEEALWSDQNGPRDLAADTVTALLDRFAADQLTLSTDTVATVAGRHLAGDLTLSAPTVTGVLRAHAARDLDLPANLVGQLRAAVQVSAELTTALDDRALPSEWAMPQADRDARALLEGFLVDSTVLPTVEDPDPADVADALDRYLAGNFPVSTRALDRILDAWQHDQLNLPNDLAARVGTERPPPKSTVERLRDHAAGRWPLSDQAVAYALDRHLSGVEPLPVALVGKLAARYAAGHLDLPDDLVSDLLDAYRNKQLRLPDTVAAGVVNQFSGVPHLPLMVRLTVPETPPHGAPQATAAPPPATSATAGPALPAHMLADGRAVLGFGAPERIELASSLPEVIRGLLRQVAPEAVRDWSLSSALGLLRQIGDQYSTPGVRALVDELFGSGLRLAFVNPRGHLGAELISIKLQAGALHNPVALGVESRAGMENYAYANHTNSRTWTNSRSRTWTGRLFGSGVPANQDPAADHLTSLAGGASHSRTQNRSVSTTSADTVTSARTVFDWSGNRDFGVEFTIVAEVTRSPMPGRPVNQAYTAAFQAAEDTYRQAHQQTKRPVRAVDIVQGAMTWRLPRALSDPAQGTDGPYGIRGNPPRGRFRLPDKFYPEGFTGLDTLLDAAQRAVGRQTLQEATRNGQTVAWFLGAHAVRANLDRIVDRDGYEFSGLFEPGLVAELFADLKVKGTLRDPVKLREFSSMALGHYLKREQFTKTGSTAGVSRGTNADLGATTRTDTVDQANPSADGGAHNAGISGIGGLATGMSAPQDAQRGTRDETHAKITGPVWLVQAELDLRLTSRKWQDGLLWKTSPRVRGATETTSTVYLYLFEHDALKIFQDLENARPRQPRQLQNRYDVSALGSLFRPHPGLRVVSEDVAQDASAIPLRPLRTNAKAGPSTGRADIDIVVEAPSDADSSSDDAEHTPVIPPPPAGFLAWPKPVAHSYGHGDLVDIATQVGDADWARRDTDSGPDQSLPRDGDLDGRCAWLLSALRTELYRDVRQGPGGREITFSGVRPGESADDLAVGARGARPQQQEFASSTGWTRPESLQALEDAVFQAGVGATAFIHRYRRSGVGHAFALHHSRDGLRYLDPTDRKTPVATPGTRPSIVEQGGGSRDPLESDADLRALVVDATGQARPQAFAHVVESRSARALVDPPTSAELGSRRRVSRAPGNSRPVDAADPAVPTTGATVAPSRGPAGFWPFNGLVQGRGRPETVQYDDEALTSLVTDVVQDVPPRGDNCVELLLAVRDRLYAGVRGDRPVDDLAVDTRRGREQFASTTGWPRPASLVEVFDAVDAVVGRSAFLHLFRANRPGHAVVLHRAVEGLRLLDPANSGNSIVPVSSAAQVRALVGRVVGVRALVTGPAGTVLPEAFVEVAESGSVVDGLTDPADPGLHGGGLELELLLAFRFPGKRPAENVPLVRGRYVTLVADGLTGDIPEIVTVPTNVLGDEGWPDPDAVFAEIEELWDGLLWNAQRGGVLRDAFASSHGGSGAGGDGRFVVEPEWEDVSVGFMRKGEVDAYVQHTMGVPVAGLYKFLRFVAKHPLENADETTIKGLSYLKDGLDFGVAAARGFDTSPGVSASLSRSTSIGDPAVTLAGYLALVYYHAAALAHRHQDIRHLFKNRVLALSRVELDGVRAALPVEIRAFLEVAAPWVRTRFAEFLTAREPGLAAQLTAASGDRHLLDTTLAGEDGAAFALGDYLDTALSGQPRTVVGHRAAFDLHTVLAEVDPGGGQLPLAPLELRAFGRHMLDDTDAVREEYDLLATEIRDQYQQLVSGWDDGGDPFAAPAAADTTQPLRTSGPGIVPAHERLSYLRDLDVAGGTGSDDLRVWVSAGDTARIQVPYLLHTMVQAPDALTELNQVARERGFHLVVWTPLSSGVMDALIRDQLDGPGRGVAQVLGRATYEGFPVVSIAEVFDDAAPMERLGDAYLSESRRPGESAAMPRLAAAEILHRFGGVYLPAGAPFTVDFAAAAPVGADGLGFGRTADGEPSAEMIVAAARSRGTEALLDLLAERHWAAHLPPGELDLISRHDSGWHLASRDHETRSRLGLSPDGLDTLARRLYGPGAGRARLHATPSDGLGHGAPEPAQRGSATAAGDPPPVTGAVSVTGTVAAWGVVQHVADMLRDGSDLGGAVDLLQELPSATRSAAWYAAVTLAGFGDWREADPQVEEAVVADDRYQAHVAEVDGLLRGDQADRETALRQLDESHSPEAGVPPARSVHVVPGHRSWFSPADWSVNVAAELTDPHELGGALLTQLHQKVRVTALLRRLVSAVPDPAELRGLTGVPLEVAGFVWRGSSPEPVRYDDEALTSLVTDVVQDVPPRRDNCVALLLAIRDRLYAGVRGDRPVDDLAVDTRRGREQFASTTAWPRPASLDDVIRVVDAGVGRSAFLHLFRANEPGHAIVLHRAVEGLRLLDPANSGNSTVPVSDTAQVRALVGRVVGVRALVTDPAGAVLPDAFDEAVESELVLAGLTDPVDPRLHGGGLELELPLGLRFPGKHPAGNVALVRGKYVTLVADGFTANIPEIVTVPTKMLDHESWPDPDAVFAETKQLWDRLLRVARHGGVLADGFATSREESEEGGDGDRLVVEPEWKDVSVGFLKWEEDAYIQYTAGVPVVGLYEFLRFVAQHPPENAGGKTTEGLRYLKDGLDFGIAVTREFGPSLPSTESIGDPSVTLAGYLALVYHHAAALAHRHQDIRDLFKNRVLALSRVEPDGVRAALPVEIRALLEVAAPWVRTRFTEFLTAREPGLVDQIRGASGSSRLLDTTLFGRDGTTFSLGDYLDTALSGQPRTLVGHRDAFEMHTVLPEMDPGGGQLPLAPLELRAFGRNLQGNTDAVRQEYDLLATEIRDQYQRLVSGQDDGGDPFAAPAAADTTQPSRTGDPGTLAPPEQLGHLPAFDVAAGAPPSATGAVSVADAVTAWDVARQAATMLRDGSDLGAAVHILIGLPYATRSAAWYAAVTLAGSGDWREADPHAEEAAVSEDRYWADVEGADDLLRGDRADRETALRQLDRSHSAEADVPPARSLRVVPGHRSWFSPADWSVNVAAALTDPHELGRALLTQIHQRVRITALLRSLVPAVSSPAELRRLTDIPLEATRYLWQGQSPDPVRYDDEALMSLVRDVLEEAPPHGDDDVNLLVAIRDRLYPGVRGNWPVDDPSADTRHGPEQFASTTAWPTPASLDEVTDAVAAEVGRSAFLHSRANEPDHAIVLHRSVEGLRLLDAANINDPVTAVSDAAQLRALVGDAVGVRAVVTTPAGTVLPDAFRQVEESESVLDGLTEPSDPSLGAHDSGRDRPDETLPQRLTRLSLLNLTPAVRADVVADPLFQAMHASPRLAEILRATAGSVLRPDFYNTAAVAELNQYLLTQVPHIAALVVAGETIAAGLTANTTPSGRERLQKIRQEFRTVRRRASHLMNDAPANLAPQVGELVGRWHRAMQKLSSFDRATSHTRQLLNLTEAAGLGSLTRRTAYGVSPGSWDVDATSYARMLGTVLGHTPTLPLVPLATAGQNTVVRDLSDPGGTTRPDESRQITPAPPMPSTGNLPAVRRDQAAEQRDQLIFQLGTNNWQRGGEFAPGSGILHEAHHHAYNELPGWRCYSMYPSQKQRFQQEDVRVFELTHPIPICESVSPSSEYRWHGMSEDQVTAYRERLTNEVETWMNEIEARTGERFHLAIAHHGFMNTVVMRDVIRRRENAGRARIPLLDFVHGTELKMYNNEQRGDKPVEFPKRFLPFMKQEKIFDYNDPAHGVDMVAAISEEQIREFGKVFPEFPSDRVMFSQNGYNRHAFHVQDDDYVNRAEVLAGFRTAPARGSDGKPTAKPTSVNPKDGFDAVVAFCGKFADWKRLDALLDAAAIYEQGKLRILTLVIGGGPDKDQLRMQNYAAELGLKRTYFLGPRQQDELAVLFNSADVGVFPSKNEPFGLVFIECMATGTPVIGANSGGPRDFVTSAVGELVPETDDRGQLARSLADAVTRAVSEDWKTYKGPAAAANAREFTVEKQVAELLEQVGKIGTVTWKPEPRDVAGDTGPDPVSPPDQVPQVSDIATITPPSARGRE